MTHDEAAALALPATCWHEAMGDDDWEAAPVRVEQYRLAPGASIKSFVCRDETRLYLTSVDHIYLTRGEVEVELVREMQESAVNFISEIEEMWASITKIKQHSLWQDEHKGLSQALASAPHAGQHALEATAQIKLQRWLDVFGHLSTDPDVVGNIWMEVGDDNNRRCAAIQTLLDLGMLNVRASDTRAEAGARVAAQDALIKCHGAPSDNRNYLTAKS